mmetsp:Transcript_1533/g.2087  ORF Transcript_1533/g.2087 Transcript_1533/m.2087 type:complete len:225 (-) Transcript_1533:327-1001(-)
MNGVHAFRHCHTSRNTSLRMMHHCARTHTNKHEQTHEAINRRAAEQSRPGSVCSHSRITECCRTTAALGARCSRCCCSCCCGACCRSCRGFRSGYLLRRCHSFRVVGGELAEHLLVSLLLLRFLYLQCSLDLCELLVYRTVLAAGQPGLVQIRLRGVQISQQPPRLRAAKVGLAAFVAEGDRLRAAFDAFFVPLQLEVAERFVEVRRPLEILHNLNLVRRNNEI